MIYRTFIEFFLYVGSRLYVIFIVFIFKVFIVKWYGLDRKVEMLIDSVIIILEEKKKFNVF